MDSRRGVQSVVSQVAAHLIGVDSDTVQTAYVNVLRDLVRFFDIDASFLRHTDLEARTSILIAEWPPREVPNPDPLGVVSFDSDSVFARTERLTTPIFFHPEPATEDYRQRVQAATGFEQTSTAVVPMVSAGRNVGMLGFAKIGDREWTGEEKRALVAIASLFTQLLGRLRAEDRLMFVVDHDPLTGVLNRRGLYTRLTERLARDIGDMVAVLFVDLDRWKILHDNFGPRVSEPFLTTVANTLVNSLPVGTTVARWGGDEFVVVLDHICVEDEAVDFAETVQHRIAAEPLSVEGELYPRTLSIGISTGTSADSTADDLISNADQAVIAAKTAGGRRVVLYDPRLHSRNELSNDIELHLRAAIADGELVLHFQPEVDLRTDTISGVEALVRWNHPVRGLLSPDQFVPIAEAANLSVALGRWVLVEACRIYSTWMTSVPNMSILLRINISPPQLLSEDFLPLVRSTLADFDVDPRSVCLEITEAAVVNDLERSALALRELRAIGVTVAIDDFGTGYSSLSHLLVLPVDTLKIDRTFVAELATNPRDQAIVRTIATLADHFRLRMIAEGVEDRASVPLLLDVGCTHAQGFLFSRPIPADVMKQMLLDGLPAR